MKKITLLIAILFAAISWQTNAQVAIGNGTEEKSIPINPFYGYSYSQNIYLASEINASGTITSLKFRYNGHSNLVKSKDWVVYLGHTSKTAFDSTTDWIPVADLTEVYNGTITAVGSGSPEWITIDITDFAYNGTDNLVVAVDENTSGYDSSSDDFYASAVTGNRSIVFHADSSNPDPASPPEADDVQAFVPNIIFEGITQACPIPTDLAVSNITATGADVSWTENGSATAWNIEYGPAGFTQGQGTTVAASSNPFTLSGLTSGTVYDVYVQADCGGGDGSSWEGPVSFNTMCEAVTTYPYIEDFESGISICWNETRTPASNYGWAGYNTGHSGKCVRFNSYVNADSNVSSLTTGVLDLTSLTNPVLSFYYKNPTGGDFTVSVSTDGGANFTVLESGLTGQTDWVQKTYDLSSYSSNNVIIEFKGTSNYGSGDAYIYLDDFAVQEAPSCLSPTDLAVSNITTTGADVSWTENGSATAWNIEYGPTGFTQGQGTTVAASSNPFTLSGLTSGTAYDVYVQADCGGGDSSSWAGPVSFNTVCEAKVAPYSQNFDAATPPDLPVCWSKIVDATSSYAKVGTTTTNNSAPNGVKLYNSSDDSATLLLITPEFSDLTSQSNQIRFKAKGDGYDLIIGTMSDPNDQTTFTAFTTVTLTSSFEEYIVRFDSYSGSDQFIAFKHGLGGTYRSIYIDDFNYEPMPSCIQPSDLAVANITTTGADISWTENGSATAWNIEYGPAGFTQGQGTTVAASSNPFTLSGLTSLTSYDVYVQADCGGGDSSSWTGPYTFATPPGCGATFYDDGGATGDYSANLNQTITIYPTNAGDVVTVTFNSFDMENKWDGMMVYDGTDTNAPLIDSGSTYNHTNCPNGAWTGAAGDPFTANGHSFTSTDTSGALTFVFTSDSSTQNSGWEAVVTCGPQAISDNQIAGFKFYPNPVNHTLNLSAKDNIQMISISNVMGQEVLHLLPNATETQVNMSSLQNGIYFVKAQINGELTAFKVIKK